MPAATAPWAGPPPKSPKATNPAMGFTVSNAGSSETNLGGAVVVVVGAVEAVEDDAISAPCSRRVGAQAVRKPAPRSPSICRRESGAGAIDQPYLGPDRGSARQTGKSGGNDAVARG